MSKDAVTVDDFKNQCRDAFKEDMGETRILRHISTGAYDVDKALGGGLSLSRFHLWAGKESAGKTSLSLHAMREANLINWDTGEYDPSLENPTPVMFVDLEGTFDESWASKIGVRDFDNYNFVVSHGYGEMAADMVINALEARTFGLIIVDSNEAFVSLKALEKSAEDHVMCDRAKILSRMYRAGQSHLNKKNKEQPWKNPAVLCLNQVRDDIGSMHGGYTYPGGRAQLQYSSTIIQFNAPMVTDDAKKSYGMGEFKGVTKKNKTHPPKKNFLFKMAIRDLSEDGQGLKAGQIDNASSILKDIKDLGLMEKTDSGYNILGRDFRVQSDFKDALWADEAEMRRVWKLLLEIHRK